MQTAVEARGICIRCIGVSTDCWSGDVGSAPPKAEQFSASWLTLTPQFMLLLSLASPKSRCRKSEHCMQYSSAGSSTFVGATMTYALLFVYTWYVPYMV